MGFRSPEDGAEREKFDRYREKQVVNPALEKKIIERVNQFEHYADMLFCPEKDCGLPLEKDISKESIRLVCEKCSWEKELKR